MEESWYKRNKAKVLKRLKEKYENDPKFREKARKQARDRYHNDEEYRKSTLQRAKLRNQERKNKNKGQ